MGPGQPPGRSSVRSTHEPEGGTRVWATFPDEAGAAGALEALTGAGIPAGRISLAEDPGASDGPIAHEREHREGGRIGGRLAAGAVVGGSLGALFLGGVGAFVAGLSGLRSAALDHRHRRTEPPGGAAVEVRGDEGDIGRALKLLRARRPATLAVTDAFGRPLEDLPTERL